MLPTTVPSVAVVEAAPLTSVVAVAGLNDAPPLGVALQVTCTPWAGCPLEPRATKLSGNVSAAPVAAVWLSPAMPVTDAATGPASVLPPHATAAAIIAATATGANLRSLFMVPPSFGHDAVQYLAVSNHSELLPRDALLHRGVGFQVVRQLGQ